MDTLIPKKKRDSGYLMKLFGSVATFALVMQLLVPMLFSPGSASAQTADASLTVTKVVDGGDAVVGDFALFVDGMPVTSGVATTTLEAGTYTVTETNLPGYTATFSGDCNASGEVTLTASGTAECIITNTFTASTSSLTVTKVVDGGDMEVSDFPLFVDGVPVMSGVATTTLGEGTFTVTETNLPGYSATFSGDCNADGEVTLTFGGDFECTITNTFSTSTATTSSLTVTKVVDGGSATTSDFTLFVNGVPVTSGVATTTLGAGDFTVTEDNLPGYTATFSGDCSADGVISLALGDDLECVITNTFSTSTATTTSLTVTKVVEGGGSFTAEDFPLFVNGMPIESGVATTTLGAGTFVITETNRDNYDTTFSGACNASGVVTLTLGAEAECVITNTYNPQSIFSGGGGGGNVDVDINNDSDAGDVTINNTFPPSGFDPVVLPSFPGQVLGVQSIIPVAGQAPFSGQVLGVQSTPGMPTTGAEPLADSEKALLLSLLGIVAAGVGLTLFRSRTST